ncbi:helix-turn-helix domain-containing protein [Enterobacter cloacae subsp. cloacae]|uniref:helix-turn-helix domain-containing protein n=1 Tax=Enterobacter cloacae TaxID=550 RepID=UPI001C5B4F7F|nr:helix-turn-helix domain-containing protein [Enterobacter cloacae]MBW4217869.1 helix-turn-helix domain-containing protein [Enterobacter cloacae subsp. cloacae]
MKPLRQIENVIMAVSVPSNVRLAHARQIISLSHSPEPMTMILHKGTMAVYRNNDNLLMRHIKGTMILGLNELMDINKGVYLKAEGNACYELIPTRSFFTIVERDNLWKDVAYLLMFSAKRLAESYETSAGLSTYELIKANLIGLMDEDEYIRLNISACDYIQEKTNLSRSRIMAILRELKIGGYIDLSKGVLNRINKLPLKF